MPRRTSGSVLEEMGQENLFRPGFENMEPEKHVDPHSTAKVESGFVPQKFNAEGLLEGWEICPNCQAEHRSDADHHCRVVGGVK